MEIIQKPLQDWTCKDIGYGSGDGYGDGDGDGDGYGYGYGYGSGDGDGYGYGDGDGDGYGSGDGDGDGYGSGDGDGDGSGDGDGDGYGYGYGSGDGDGYGYGYSDGDGKTSWIIMARSAIAAWPNKQQQRFIDLEKSEAVLALWKSDAGGKASNGGAHTTAVYPGLVEKIDGPLEICTQHALHATMNPDKWKGERVWVVALFGEVQQLNDKYGALIREIVGEVPL